MWISRKRLYETCAHTIAKDESKLGFRKGEEFSMGRHKGITLRTLILSLDGQKGVIKLNARVKELVQLYRLGKIKHEE